MNSHGALILAAAVLGGLPPADVPETISDDVKLTLVDLSVVATILELDRIEKGSFPKSDGEVVRLDSIVEGFEAALQDRVPTRDVWRQSLLYLSDGISFAVISTGSDRVQDTEYEWKEHIWEIVDRTPCFRGCDIVMTNSGVLRAPATQQTLQLISMRAIQTAARAVVSFKRENEIYPVTSGWAFLEDIDPLLAPLYPEFIDALPTRDGWGNPLRVWSTGETYMILSSGADGIEDAPYGHLDDPRAAVEERMSRDVNRDLVIIDGRFVQRPEITVSGRLGI